jgi:hypothetical protein
MRAFGMASEPFPVPDSESDSEADVGVGSRTRIPTRTGTPTRVRIRTRRAARVGARSSYTRGAAVLPACPDAKEPRLRLLGLSETGAPSRFFRWGGHASKTAAPPTLPRSGSLYPRHRSPSPHRRAYPPLRSRLGRATSTRTQLLGPQHRGRQPQPRWPSSCALLHCGRVQRRVTRRAPRRGRLGVRRRARHRVGRRSSRSRRGHAPRLGRTALIAGIGGQALRPSLPHEDRRGA